MPDLEGTGAQTRRRFRDLEPFESDLSPNKAFAEYVSAAPATPMGHFEVTVGTSPVGLPSIPEDCRRAVLYSIDEDFTYTDTEGDTPSSSHGMIIPAGSHFIYDTDPDEHFLMWAASNTVVRVAYYG